MLAAAHLPSSTIIFLDSLQSDNAERALRYVSGVAAWMHHRDTAENVGGNKVRYRHTCLRGKVPEEK